MKTTTFLFLVFLWLVILASVCLATAYCWTYQRIDWFMVFSNCLNCASSLFVTWMEIDKADKAKRLKYSAF